MTIWPLVGFIQVLRERKDEWVQINQGLMQVAAGSTEQLSLVHTMVAVDMDRIAFWVDQLKHIHGIRYGIGLHPPHLAYVIAHTRAVTRSVDGFLRLKVPFL